MEMIRTERLIIRRITEDDWRFIQSIWMDAATTEFAQYDKPNILDDDSVRKRIQEWASYIDSTEHIFYVVCLQNTAIGYVTFNVRENGYEIGYCFHSSYHGQGYAKESIAALIDKMREQGVSRITAGTALENTPSVNLLESLDFKQIGTEEVSFYKDSAGCDIIFKGGIYELLF